MSVQAQLQQNQTVRSDQPSIAKPSTQPPLGRSFVAPSITPKVSLDKIPESENESTMKLGRSPKSFRCECCQHVTVTRTTYQVGALTWIMAVVIFLCGGILGCFLIPFLVDCCKDVRHECPFCGTEIGVVKCI
ncbi:Lipopolysaccharide-induced tumor necrosis factor-alpha factor [Schistosoma japonicum]|nr:Lipopolysaccharide-induced tumor necrosis factor-alpha factor [Schistosoma japonicum]KAH8867734.1 Lipopolysaccharide-induced tumor necrosis factor-alpha factor [Schistosoma japonicum]